MAEDMEDIMTPEEVAKYLRVNPRTVYRGLNQGQIPGIKIGRLWRIRKEDLDRLATSPKQDEEHS